MKKKVIGYAVILIVAILMAIHGKIWDGNIGGLILMLATVLCLTIWEDHCNEQSKKKVD